MKMAKLSAQLLVLSLCLGAMAIASAKRFTPPRRELTVTEGPKGLLDALKYPCEDDKSKVCHGIPHIEALFGVTSYGEQKIGHLYDATPMPGSTGCHGSSKGIPVYKRNPAWEEPFVLLVNRGACRFTEKVRYAQTQGASAVIIVDNVALASEPLAICEDFTTPMYASGSSWRACGAQQHPKDCKCGLDHSQNSIPVPTAPRCLTKDSSGVAVFPNFLQSCPSDSGSALEGKACWECKGEPKTTYYAADCTSVDDGQHCVRDYFLPFMADDGFGGDITIPSVMISDYQGALLRHGIDTYSPAAVHVKMEWNLPLLTNANLELWTSCEDSAGADFKLDFKETMLRLISHLTFQPRYFIFDGHALQCDKKYDCGTQCLSNGKYCGIDPNGKVGKGVEGKDVVMENLRQLCIWKVLNDNVRKGAPRTELMKWWCYANDFSDQCFDFGGEAEIQESDDFVQCSNKVMVSHDIDVPAVSDCISKSFKKKGSTDESNIMLDTEIRDRKDYAILTLPTAIVNGRELRGQTQYGATMEANVARAVCQGFETVPVECDHILNPRGTMTGQIDPKKLGKVTFLAELTVKKPDKTAGKPLTAASFAANTRLQQRFTNALALKTGADPLALSFEQAQDADSGGVQIGVAVTNLACYHGEGQTDITTALKKMSDCGEDLGDEGGEDEAAQELKGIVFNIHSGATEVISVAVTDVSIDNTLCDDPPRDADDTKGSGSRPGSTDGAHEGKGGDDASDGTGGSGSGSGSGKTSDGSQAPANPGLSPAGMYFLGVFTVLSVGGIVMAVQRYRNYAPAPPLGKAVFSSSGTGLGDSSIVSAEDAGTGTSMAEYNAL